MKKYKSIFKEKIIEKEWSKMSTKEKKNAFNVAILSGDVEDTFEGFSKMMKDSTFDVNTGNPIEVY